MFERLKYEFFFLWFERYILNMLCMSFKFVDATLIFHLCNARLTHINIVSIFDIFLNTCKCDFCSRFRNFNAICKNNHTKNIPKHRYFCDWTAVRFCRFKWSRRESNPCPKNYPMYFYRLSWLFRASAALFLSMQANQRPCIVGSFIIRPHTQSLVCVVSYIIDAWVLMCRCTKSDSCH